MAVKVTLFGFGDDCPQGFINNTRKINTGDTKGLEQILNMAGFNNLEGLVILVNDTGVHQDDWSKTQIKNHDSIKILSAIEGG